jgi:hypothetical protein
MPPVISSIERLPELSMDLIPSGLEYAIVESAAEILFLDLASSPLAACSCFPRGLAFGKDVELRWVKRASGRLHVVCIDDRGRSLHGAEHSTPLERLGEERLPDKFLLLGERESDGAFRDGRIPRPLDYPFAARFAAAGGLAVSLRHYRFPESGRELYRCAAVIEASRPEAPHE